MLNEFHLRENCPLIMMQFQIANICSIRLWTLYLISEASEWNINDLKCT